MLERLWQLETVIVDLVLMKEFIFQFRVEVRLAVTMVTAVVAVEVAV